MSSQPKAPCIGRHWMAVYCNIMFEWLEQFISKQHGLSAVHSASVSYLGDRGPCDTCTLNAVSGATERNANWSLSAELYTEELYQRFISPGMGGKRKSHARGVGGAQFWSFKLAKHLATISILPLSFPVWRIIKLSGLEHTGPRRQSSVIASKFL